MGFGAERVARPDALQREQRLTQVASIVLCLRARDPHIGGGRNRKRLLVRANGGLGGRIARQPLLSTDPQHSNRHRCARNAEDDARCNPPQPGSIAAFGPVRQWSAMRRRAALLAHLLLHAGRLEAIEALEQGERFIGDRTVLDSRHEETSRGFRFPSLESRGSGVDELLTFPLPLGDRPARPFDVRSRPGMATIDEQRARPDVNRELVLTGEVMIEAAQQQFLDAGLAIALRFERGRQGVGVDRVGRHK